MAPSPSGRKESSDELSKDGSRGKAGPKESRGRAGAPKWSSASSGRSSSRPRSSRSPGSGSSSGSSSPSASSRSGRSSSSCSSCPGSLRPSRHRRGKRQRSHSKQPGRDGKERRRHSLSPKPTKVHIARLTRNVTKDHIREIFSTFGKVRVIDMPAERTHPGLTDAYVEFETPDEAETAMRHMDGGQIDGQEIRATAVQPARHLGPRGRMRSPAARWRRPHSGRRGGSPPARLRLRTRERRPPRGARRALPRSRSSSSSSGR